MNEVLVFELISEVSLDHLSALIKFSIKSTNQPIN